MLPPTYRRWRLTSPRGKIAHHPSWVISEMRA